MAAAVDIITLDNLESKLPRWDPSAANQLHALVDMGSNGIRFSISDLSPPRTRLLRCVYRERAAISLFDALNDNNSTGAGTVGTSSVLIFPPETIHRVAQTLARFRSIARGHGVPKEQMAVFATEAMRRATNAASMLEAIQKAAPGLVVYILAPEVEALFGSMGARSGFVNVKGLFLDLGGGSVQMTYMDSSSQASPSYEVTAAQAGQSLPFGAARLIRLLNSSDGKLKASTESELKGSMLSVFGKLCGRFPDLAKAALGYKKDENTPGVDVYLCGGGFRGYGSMLMHNDPIQPYPIPLIGNYSASGAFFRETKKMRKVNKSYEGKVFGMSNRRREQFPAIAAVVEGLIDAVPNIRSVTFCAGGNREGVLMMKLPRDVREANPLPILGSSASPSSGPAVPRDAGSIQGIVDTLQSAVPSDVPADQVLPISLAPILATRIWDRCGEGDAANAASALHDAATRDPSAPGLDHLARASLAITLWARWGGKRAPVDTQLLENLHKLLGGPQSNHVFWAEYVGAVAAVLALVFPVWPEKPEEVKKSIKFEATRHTLAKKDGVQLKISVAPSLTKGLDLHDLRDCFKLVGKYTKEGKRVDVQVFETLHPVETSEPDRI